jgi:hypothetical protein
MSMVAREIFLQYRRGSGSFFLKDIAKLNEFAQNFGVYKCKTQ